MKMKAMDYITIYRRYFQMFQEAKLTDQQLGALMRTLLEYQVRGTEPENLDDAMMVLWRRICDDLEREDEDDFLLFDLDYKGVP